MTAKKKPEVPEVEVHDLSKRRGALKAIGGSMSDDWNNIVANQTIQTLWLRSSDAEQIRRQRHAAVDALIGIKPGDELEGMIAAQLVACHNASMESYRRAALGDQTFEGKQENLNQANKLSRRYTVLLDALNRHRGKGNVESRGGGFAPKAKDQPHALSHAPGTTMRSADAPREPVPVARDEERPLPNARRDVSGRPEG
jgi:hypothetical protein